MPRKRRNSTGSALTPNKVPRAGARSPTTTPRRSSRMSVITSYTVAEEGVEAAIVADAVTSPAVPTQETQPSVSQQSTPSSTNSKSSAGSSSSEPRRRGRRSKQTLQVLSESLDTPSPLSSTASDASEAAEAEPESESAAADAADVASQQPTRQLEFDNLDEKTDSDDEHESEASQDSDYVPERADEQSQDDENETASRDEERSETGGGVVLPSGMKARRQTKFWEPEEESFLRRGVATHGMGKWKIILMEGCGVFSSHRTNIDLKDKWKNLQIRGGNPPKPRKKATPPPESSASAEEPEEIDISDSDDFVSRVPATRIRAVKKPRTAALVATASFAAVRNAELSQSQADSLDLENYHSVDNSYEVEETVQESEGEHEHEQEQDDSESRPVNTAAVANQPTPRNPPKPAPKPTVRAAVKAKAPAPETTSSASTTAKAKKTVHESSAESPKATMSGLAKFQFATDDTYPEMMPMEVNMKLCPTMRDLKERVRKSLLRDVTADTSIEIVGITSRRLIQDDDDTEVCFRKYGHSYYLVY